MSVPSFLWPHNPWPFGFMVLGLALAAFVWHSGHRSRVSRLAALVIGLESLMVGGGGLYAFSDGPQWVFTLTGSLFVVLIAVYPRLVATLDTPWARPFRGPRAAFLLAAFALVLIGVNALNGWHEAGSDFPAWAIAVFPAANIVMMAGVVLGLVGLGAYALVAAISAYRRTPPGSPARRRAKSWVVAFGTRDALWILHVLAVISILATVGERSSAMFYLWTYVAPMYSVLYMGLLAYGILRTQLFDIDLKIKWGISRGTTASIMIIAVLAASKTAEFYVTREIGYVAGGVAAGTVLFLAPRINKIGDKVAKTALPNVENTSQYLAFRRLEVYQAAVQSAIEGGGVSEKERDTLRRLSAKLGINPEDAARLEADLSMGAAPPPASAPAAS